MVSTIAIRGHSGNVGRHVLSHLIKAHQEGKIKLVVLHRPESTVDGIPDDIELRAIDTDSEQGKQNLREQLKGIQALIATLGVAGLASQSVLLEALADSPDFVTFFPSEYGAPWTQEMLVKESMKNFEKFHSSTIDKARELGVSLTRVKAGLFPDYLVMEGFVGVYPKANKIELYKDALNKPIHISAYEHLGAVIAELAARPLESIRDKAFYTYSHSPTGQDIIQYLTSVNKTAPQVIEYTDADYDHDTDGANPYAMVAATYRKRWGEGEWGWSSVQAEWIGIDIPLMSFEELAKNSTKSQ